MVHLSWCQTVTPSVSQIETVVSMTPEPYEQTTMPVPTALPTTPTVTATATATATATYTSQPSLSESPIPPTPSPIQDTLFKDQTLRNDQSILSQNRMYSVKMQSDGNLVIYKDGVTPLWASGTAGRGGGNQRVVMQGDNNLAIHSDHGVLWSSGTECGTWPAAAKIQDDGNFVIYDGDYNPIWVSNTDGGKISTNGTNKCPTINAVDYRTFKWPFW